MTHGIWAWGRINKSWWPWLVVSGINEYTRFHSRTTLQGINISHLGKRKIIFKMAFLGDMLVSCRVFIWFILLEPLSHFQWELLMLQRSGSGYPPNHGHQPSWMVRKRLPKHPGWHHCRNIDQPTLDDPWGFLSQVGIVAEIPANISQISGKYIYIHYLYTFILIYDVICVQNTNTNFIRHK